MQGQKPCLKNTGDSILKAKLLTVKKGR